MADFGQQRGGVQRMAVTGQMLCMCACPAEQAGEKRKIERVAVALIQLHGLLCADHRLMPVGSITQI